MNRLQRIREKLNEKFGNNYIQSKYLNKQFQHKHLEKEHSKRAILI